MANSSLIVSYNKKFRLLNNEIYVDVFEFSSYYDCYIYNRDNRDDLNIVHEKYKLYKRNIPKRCSIEYIFGLLLYKYLES